MDSSTLRRCRAGVVGNARGAIFAQPFSEGSAAAAGKAPFGTLATKVDGGYLVTGRKIFGTLDGKKVLLVGAGLFLRSMSRVSSKVKGLRRL